MYNKPQIVILSLLHLLYSDKRNELVAHSLKERVHSCGTIYLKKVGEVYDYED